jgi:hypothetical protein
MLSGLFLEAVSITFVACPEQPLLSTSHASFAMEETMQVALEPHMFKTLVSLLVPVTGVAGPRSGSSIHERLFIWRDMQEVLNTYRRMRKDGHEWQQYTQQRLKMLEGLPGRRIVAYEVKGWMIKNRLLKDRQDYLRP